MSYRRLRLVRHFTSIARRRLLWPKAVCYPKMPLNVLALPEAAS